MTSFRRSAIAALAIATVALAPSVAAGEGGPVRADLPQEVPSDLVSLTAGLVADAAAPLVQLLASVDDPHPPSCNPGCIRL